MTDSKTTPQGKLFYLVGSSGAGKDSLLTALSQRADISGLHVARRYITRMPTVNDEQHLELSQDEFDRREREGDFLFTWRSHGHSYALEAELLDRITRGEDVVVNGSRAYLQTALSIYPGLRVVWISVSGPKLRERLLARGRESEAEIDRRLARNLELESRRAPGWPCISNDADLESTCEQFLKIRNA